MKEGLEIDGCWHEDWDDYLYSMCGLCCCGTQNVAALLLQVLVWCNRGNQCDEDREIEPFGNRGTYTGVQYELAAKILDSKELLDHGTGIGWPWITDKGREVLANVKRFKELYREAIS